SVRRHLRRAFHPGHGGVMFIRPPAHEIPDTPMAVSREGTQGRTIREGDQMGCQAHFESMQRPAL
ncbi:hypothetical protein, partial [Sphingomonas sp. 1185]|uniref:hypothetical protein n=1 Tax=Sphingomonas sp. 1185 TaxID=3156411 RepID=UPI00339A0128